MKLHLLLTLSTAACCSVLAGNAAAQLQLKMSGSLAELKAAAGSQTAAAPLQTPACKPVVPASAENGPARKRAFKPGDIVLQSSSFRTVESIDRVGRIWLAANRSFMRVDVEPNEISLVVPEHGGYKAGDVVIYHPQRMRFLWKDSPRMIEAVDDTGNIVLAADEYYARVFTRVESIRRPGQ